jgi:Fe-S cluster assembly protein SufD
MTQLAEEKVAHVRNFAALEKASNGDVVPWLDARRREGIERFDLIGFPNPLDEDWRHTQLGPIVKTKFSLAGAGAPKQIAEEHAEFSFGDDAISEIVFVNGHYHAQLSKLGKLPRGVKVLSLARALETDAERIEPHLARVADIESNPFVALNTGFLQDGAYLFFPRGTTIAQPIHLLFISTPAADPAVSHPRVLVIAEDNVEATIVESYVGSEGKYFTNAVTEIVCGADCRIDHCKLQQESQAAYHVATMQVILGRATTFVSHAASIGSRITRNNLNCLMNGEGAYATLNGLVLIGGEQHVDNHTLLDHAEPNCPSHELYKHVLNGKATGVFRGKILVRQKAQKTDSKQNSKSLLLSDDAYMNSQPALEIYADDVKCTHGSTTGPVDEDMVFYLRTRGVGLAEARHLLTYAFAADVTRRIKVEPFRRRLESYMAKQAGLPEDLRITDLSAHDEAVL